MDHVVIELTYLRKAQTIMALLETQRAYGQRFTQDFAVELQTTVMRLAADLVASEPGSVEEKT